MAGLLGCSSDGDGTAQADPAAGRFERLDLRYEDPDFQAPEVRVVQSFAFPDALQDESPWTIPDGCERRVIADEPVLVMPREGAFDLDLDVEVDPQEVTRVMIRGVFGKGTELQVLALTGGEVRANLGKLSPQPVSTPQSLDFDLLRFRRVVKAYDSLRVRVVCQRPPARLMTLE